ncbi:DUF2071 domain-containing protein [Dongshaea marina]|uniref:DUF2071 domain-containing protein n=1 Tax=Dongshaea marina TaxID=2047966 RepID=UPI000D3E6E59|nr:DUF2071 domain-containing protein [Dongshaea marina]
MQPRLRFETLLQAKTPPKGIDVECKLQHFAIISYAIDPKRIAPLIPPRFAPDLINISGQELALLSVVPFIDIDFTSAVYPFPKFTMGQTNYRIYVKDTQTAEHCVWFLGTTLDSWTLPLPKYLWKLPWYRGKIHFDCEYCDQENRYTKYQMHTHSQWAPASVSLSQVPASKLCLSGFADDETALAFLTHPLTGFYRRRDGQLGSYRVWHDKIPVQAARLECANFGLLSNMGLVSPQEQQDAHSVLICPMTEFTIYLPPSVVKESPGF